MSLMGDVALAGAPSVASGLMGLAGQAIGNKMQRKQAAKLQDLQIKGSKEMANYNRLMQMRMWEDTNYAAQVEQMQKAGLNIGLMYGGGGAGGATASSSPGNVSGQSTQDFSGLMGRTPINPLVGAQIENIKADTKVKEAEAEFKGGVQTESLNQSIQESVARINNLEAVTTNEQIKSDVLAWEVTLKELEATKASGTLVADIESANAALNKLQGEAESARNAGRLSTEAYDELLKQTKQTTIEQGLRMLAIEAGIDKTKVDTEKAKKEIKLVSTKIWEIHQKVGQGWQQLTINEQERYLKQIEVELNEKITEFNTNDLARAAQWTGVFGALIGGAAKVATIKR